MMTKAKAKASPAARVTHVAGAKAAAESREEAPLWEFVALGDYAVPGTPASSAMENAWKAIRRTFRNVNEEAQQAIKDEAELRALPELRMAHLVPAIDWDKTAAALDARLDEWANSPGKARPVKFVIGQPFCAHGEIARRWAARHRATVVAAPDEGQILSADRRWLEALPREGGLWVLPELERCYLRHASGLALVREVLERAESGELGPGVIGCDSWAWAYLQRIWPVPRPDALTLQAFDGLRLARLLAGLVTARSRQRIAFRNARTGNEVLTVPSEVDQASAEIVALAAHCRGNVGTAIHYWRERLRCEPDAGEPASGTAEAAVQDGDLDVESVWLSATMPEPALFADMDEDVAFVLHALLLHGGLRAELLPELLPLSRPQCMAILLRLRNAGLAELRGDRWRVCEMAYATVRALLRSRDYLTDDF